MERDSATRRQVIAATGLAIGAGSLAGCTSGNSGNGNGNGNGNGDGNGDGNGGGGSPQDFGGWFDDVSNYDGVDDRTGSGEVTVDVGAGEDGLLFAPPAIRVDAGTTVVWEWTGEGGAHNVEADTGDFESDLMSDAGETFEYTVESAGTVKYFCNPHKTVGMKGAVVVE